MTILNYVLLAILFCVTPAGVLWLCRRVPLFGKIGPIMTLYAIGVVIGNLPFMPDEIQKFQSVLPNVMVPLAIPMMLFGCTFRREEIKLQFKVVFSGVLSVCLATVCGYLMFGKQLHNGAEIGGMIAGKCTGGTLNMAAIKTMLNMDNETYILLNTYDIIICFIYFIFLLSVGIKLFRRLYGERGGDISAEDQAEIDRQVKLAKANPYARFFTREGFVQMGKVLGVTLVIVALAAGFAAVVVPKEWFQVAFILMLTTLGISGSLIKPVQKLDKSYDMGMYLIYIFSLAIASMADLSNLNIMGGLYQIGFMSIAIFGSLFVHALICRLLKVDADSMIISSVAFINSPPFVPMFSAAMRNKNTLITGISAGLIGYAVGNYLGFVMYELLSKL